MTLITPTAPSQVTDRIGFTVYAKTHLLSMTDEGRSGFPSDAKVRLFIMTGTDANGKTIRRELRGTTLTVFIDYTGRWGYTRLWLVKKDGSRRLVHRKS